MDTDILKRWGGRQVEMIGNPSLITPFLSRVFRWRWKCSTGRVPQGSQCTEGVIPLCPHQLWGTLEATRRPGRVCCTSLAVHDWFSVLFVRLLKQRTRISENVGWLGNVGEQCSVFGRGLQNNVWHVTLFASQWSDPLPAPGAQKQVWGEYRGVQRGYVHQQQDQEVHPGQHVSVGSHLWMLFFFSFLFVPNAELACFYLCKSISVKNIMLN